MSDDLVKRLVVQLRYLGDHAAFEPHMFHEAADRIEAQGAQIARLRDALATARREGMEDARNLLETLHKNHKYNPLTGEGSEHDVGYYRALAEGAAHILRAASEEEHF